VFPTGLLNAPLGLSFEKETLSLGLFDDWPHRYDNWFTTPIGLLVKQYEAEVLLGLLKPRRGEFMLDAGCGTGVFTIDILALGAHVIGIDISMPMLNRARENAKGYPFEPILADILNLPFPESIFDRVISVTTIEFVEDAKGAVKELFRVTRKGGSIVVATLNSLSPWAERRKDKAKHGHSLFERAIFRSPDDLRFLAPVEAVVKTAVHFQKKDDPERAMEIEIEGQTKGLNTGAFVAAKWIKP
jgi:ubiquinone/menaquinone biosynthesis C-methylase UbiE